MDIILKVRDGERIAELRGDFGPEATVLDALETFRARNAGPGSARVPPYRHSCHHGSCGTCGAIINGREGLMCLSRLGTMPTPSGPLVVELEPLKRMAVIAGIATLPGAALSGIPSDTSYLKQVDGAGGAELPPDPTGRASRSRLRFEACIECGLCASACPVRAPFTGPAALAAINREREKRPDRAGAMLALAARTDGEAACERHLACSRVCPQAVYPAKHIQLLRNELSPGRAYDAVAGRYADAFSSERARPPEARAVRQAIAAAAREAGRPIRVLELGCGPAQFLRAALIDDPGGAEISRAVAIDASASMIAKAAALAESLPPAARERLSLKVLRSEDAASLAGDGPFDLVLSVLSLRYADWEATVGALRAAAPGARFFAIDMAVPEGGARAALASLPGIALEAGRSLGRLWRRRRSQPLDTLVASEEWLSLVSRFPPRPWRGYREFFGTRLGEARFAVLSRTPRAVVFSMSGRLPS